MQWGASLNIRFSAQEYQMEERAISHSFPFVNLIDHNYKSEIFGLSANFLPPGMGRTLLAQNRATHFFLVLGPSSPPHSRHSSSSHYELLSKAQTTSGLRAKYNDRIRS